MKLKSVIQNLHTKLSKVKDELEAKSVLENQVAQVKEALTDVEVAQLLTLKGDKLTSYPITKMTEQQQLNMYAAGIDGFLGILDASNKVQAIKAFQAILQKHIDGIKLDEQANERTEVEPTEEEA